jgi:hypothetical protein
MRATSVLKTLGQDAANELAELYSLANTPGFVFSRFREHPSVAHLAGRFSAKQLVAHALHVDALSKPRVEDLVSAYAALVALTLHQPETVRSAALGVTFTNLRWADYVLRVVSDTPVVMESRVLKWRPHARSGPKQAVDASVVSSDTLVLKAAPPQ